MNKCFPVILRQVLTSVYGQTTYNRTIVKRIHFVSVFKKQSIFFFLCFFMIEIIVYLFKLVVDNVALSVYVIYCMAIN